MVHETQLGAQWRFEFSLLFNFFRFFSCYNFENCDFFSCFSTYITASKELKSQFSSQLLFFGQNVHLVRSIGVFLGANKKQSGRQTLGLKIVENSSETERETIRPTIRLGIRGRREYRIILFVTNWLFTWSLVVSIIAWIFQSRKMSFFLFDNYRIKKKRHTKLDFEKCTFTKIGNTRWFQLP